MKNCYIVAAKMDQGDAPFDVAVPSVYPDSYELVAGHVWVVSVPQGVRAVDVGKALGLIAGPSGFEDASGIVVPAIGYWGYAHRDMWKFMDAPFQAADATVRAG